MNVNNQMIDDLMASYGYTWDEPNMEYVNGDKIVSGDFASEMCKKLNAFRDVDRFEVIDHRKCIWCTNGIHNGKPCTKCDGSGVLGGRVFSAQSNPELFTVGIELSYQDDGKTLKVFVNDKGKTS